MAHWGSWVAGVAVGLVLGWFAALWYAADTRRRD